MKRQNAETRKPLIIRSFYKTILEEGFEGASIAKVARRIDINPTLVIHYFGNKENMTLELVDFVVEAYSKLFQQMCSGAGPPDERLNLLLRTIWSRQYYEKIQVAGSLSVIGVSFRNKRIQKRIKGLYRLFKNYLVEEIKALHECGVVGDQDFEKTADVLISMVEGSRHFRHFFVKTKDIDHYNQSMAMAARLLLTDASWQTT